MECIRDYVEPFAHLHFRVVADVVGAIGFAAECRCHCCARKIIGMDVIGEHIFLGAQRGRSLFEPVERQARVGVNAWCAQDRKLHAVTLRPLAKAVFGGDPSPRARRPAATWPCFGNARARAISVYAARADVDETLRYNPRLCERGDQMCGAQIVATLTGWRSEMQDREGRSAQPFK